MSEFKLAPNIITPKPDTYFLCDQAEPRLAQAFEDQALVILNDGLMLVKTVYSFVGIPLKEADVPGGRIECGMWYQPEIVDELGVDRCRANALIRETFLAGEVAIDLPGITSWMPLRRVNERRVRGLGEEDLTEKAIRIANTLEVGRSLINGMSRVDYLETNSYDGSRSAA